MSAREIILEDIVSRAKDQKNLICERRTIAAKYSLTKTALNLSCGTLLTSAVYVYLKRHTGRQIYLNLFLGNVFAMVALNTLEKDLKLKAMKQLNCDESKFDETIRFYRYAFTDRNHFFEKIDNKH